MMRITLNKLIILFFCYFISSSSFSLGIHNKIQLDINNYFKKYHKEEHFSSISVSLILPHTNGKILNFNEGTVTWMGDHQTSSKNIYFLGSITKTFTATVILDLVDRNKLFLTDTLLKLFPEKFNHSPSSWPERWKSITINQLLNMTSGIPDYLNSKKLELTFLQKNWNKKDLIMIASNLEKGMTIGSKKINDYKYSNTNYVILSLIAERITGESFDNLLNKVIFSKLSSQSILDYPQDGQLPSFLKNKLVSGYYFQNSVTNLPRFYNVKSFNLTVPNSAGGLVGNTAGIADFIYRLFHGEILSPHATYILLHNNYVSNDGALVNQNFSLCQRDSCYGDGVMIMTGGLGEQWLYEGAYFGYRSLYVWIPEKDILISIALNSGTSSDNDHILELANNLVSAILIEFKVKVKERQ